MENKNKSKIISFFKYLELGIIFTLISILFLIFLVNPNIVNFNIDSNQLSYFLLLNTSFLVLIIMIIRLVVNLMISRSVDKGLLSRNFKIFLSLGLGMAGFYLLSSLLSGNTDYGFIGYYNSVIPNFGMWISVTILGSNIFLNTYRDEKFGKLVLNVLSYSSYLLVTLLLLVVVLNLISLDMFNVSNLLESLLLDIKFTILISLTTIVTAFYKIFNSKNDLEKFISIFALIVASIIFAIFSYQLLLIGFLLISIVLIFLNRKVTKVRNVLILFTVILFTIQVLSLFTDIREIKSYHFNLGFSDSLSITTESIQENPLTGAGANSFLNSFWKYKGSNLNDGEFYGMSFSEPGSEIIRIVHDIGLPGLIIVSILGFLFVRTIITNKEEKEFSLSNYYLSMTSAVLIIALFSPLNILGYIFLVIFLSLFLANADDFFKRQNIINFTTNTIVETIPPEKNVGSGMSMIFNSVLIISVIVLSLISVSQFLFTYKVISNEIEFNSLRNEFRSRNITTERLNYIANRQREIIFEVNNVGRRGDYANEFSVVNISIVKQLLNIQEQNEDLGNTIASLIQNSIEATNKSVELYPDSLEEWKLRAEIYASMADFRGNSLEIAINSYIKAAQISPNDAEVRLNLGKAYILNLSNQDAIEQLSKAVRLKSDLHEARALLIRVYSEEGRLIDAFDDIKYFIENVDETNEYYLQVADIIDQYRGQTTEE